MPTSRSGQGDGVFGTFHEVFPACDILSVEADTLRAKVECTLGVQVPRLMVEFWRQVGAGAFADGELYVFGAGRRREWRESLVKWNMRPFWRELSPDPLPAPGKRGRLFFAETCFGDQVGLEYERNRCIPILFCPATMETYQLADSFRQLFTEVLTERYALLETSHLRAARRGVGALPKGKWYCPAVSPLVGGTGRSKNWVVMSPQAFMESAIAEYQAFSSLRGLF